MRSTFLRCLHNVRHTSRLRIPAEFFSPLLNNCSGIIIFQHSSLEVDALLLLTVELLAVMRARRWGPSARCPSCRTSVQLCDISVAACRDLTFLDCSRTSRGQKGGDFITANMKFYASSDSLLRVMTATWYSEQVLLQTVATNCVFFFFQGINMLYAI